MSAGSPIYDLQRERLGEARFQRFVEGHGALQAMTMFLVMSAMTVPQADYSDAAIEALLIDAADVRKAASEWAADCEQLAEMWRAQRQELS